ncbi:MAG: hypothetical protein QM784_27970 [Polyangiaceae bacterium]
MNAHVITLKAGTAAPGAQPFAVGALRAVETARAPELWAGALTAFQVRFQDPFTNAPLDTDNWVLVTFRVLDEERTTAHIQKTAAPEDFTGGTPKAAAFALTSAETALLLAAGGKNSRCWLTIFATLPGGNYQPLAAGVIVVSDAGLGVTAAAPTPPDSYYTAAEIDALLAGLGAPSPPIITESGGYPVFTIGGTTYRAMPSELVDAPEGMPAAPQILVDGGWLYYRPTGSTCRRFLVEGTPPGEPLTFTPLLSYADGHAVFSDGEGHSFSTPAEAI